MKCQKYVNCINELLRCKPFALAVERKDGLDLNRANVDMCYKIFNKKADGSCKKI